MRKTILKKYVGNTLILFEEINERVSLILVPKNKERFVNFTDDKEMDGLIQVSLVGDIHYACYASGQTLRNSSTSNSFKLVKQEEKEDERTYTVISTLETPSKIEVVNTLIYKKDFDAIETFNVLTNKSDKKVVVEKFDSFCLSGITPYGDGLSSDLVVHKMYGIWSAEGRQVTHSLQADGLEKAYVDYGLRIDKIGSVGSMPIKNYFPFVSIEDKTYDTFWGVYMEAPYSWDIEIARVNKNIAISGGIADYEYAHLRKSVKPNESYESTKAYLTVQEGSLDKVFNALRNSTESPVFSRKEARMPIIYNEYIDTWGNPTHENVVKAVKNAKSLDAEYFVMDAGWYCENSSYWCTKVGDWDVYKPRFPLGIDKTAKVIREAGMIPGIWFEFECASIHSNFYKEHKDWLLTRDGEVIVSGERCFLDFRKKEVINYLKEHVIDFLNNNGYAYIKNDYNECIGIGIDGKESYGAELRKNQQAFIKFVKLMRKKVKGLVFENCAAGGHRLEPGTLAVSDMASFSDAHECHEGAIVALDTNRLVPTYKNQIWGVVSSSYPLNEIRYSLAKTMYGRCCLSGDIANLSQEQYDIVKSFVKLYKKTRYICHNEENVYFSDTREQKYLDPVGEQVGLKLSKDHKAGLLIIHGFKDSKEVTIEHESLKYLRIAEIFASKSFKITQSDNKITFKIDDFDGAVVYLKEK